MTEPGWQQIQQKPNKLAERLLHQGIEVFPAVLAGFIAVFISYAGPMLLIVKAAQAAHLTAEQMASWIWAISIGAGLIGALLSWKHKMPIIFAWSTPGAALLVTALVTMPYPQAIAAYLFSALLMYLVGVTGIFERLMLLIPKSLCGAMLAGILLRFAIDIFAAAQNSSNGSSILVGILFIGYLVFKRISSRYAIVLCLITGIFLWQCFDLGVLTTLNSATGLETLQHSKNALTQVNLENQSPLSAMLKLVTRPIWTRPEFSLTAIISLGLPLTLLALTGQQMPGIAVMRAADYSPPTSQIVSGSGLISFVMAGFGSHGINLAAITAAICTGPEAHQQPEKRWIAGLACGVFYIIIGTFAGLVSSALLAFPPALVASIAGLALLGAIQNGLLHALDSRLDAFEREAALITFIVTASNISLFGIGSACWGICLGMLSYFISGYRKPG